MDLAVQQVADSLDVPVCHILATQEEGDDLLLLAATGWDGDAIGRVTLPGTTASQSGYALEAGEGVVVADYAAEHRFQLAPAVAALGVQSGLSVVILGEGKRYGVLSAYSRDQRDFGEHELDFLRTVAHTIGAAMRQQEAKAVRNELVEELRTLTETLEERVEERTQQLQKRRAQLSAVASALTVAEQRERERIAQILHDDLQQLLHALQMRVVMFEEELGDAVDDEIRKSLAELESLNEQALTVARSLTVELSPPVLEGEGLAEAFAWLALHMETVYGLHVEFDAEEKVEPANTDLRELAFQMVRELLFNVVKHAQVDEARLTLQRRDGQCSLTVADEGRGFDPSILDAADPDAAGYGLHNIRERLGLFDGTLSVNTTPGAGTRVTLRMPCRTKNNAMNVDADQARS
jgi:signal transduction histidine kinase